MLLSCPFLTLWLSWSSKPTWNMALVSAVIMDSQVARQGSSAEGWLSLGDACHSTSFLSYAIKPVLAFIRVHLVELPTWFLHNKVSSLELLEHFSQRMMHFCDVDGTPPCIFCHISWRMAAYLWKYTDAAPHFLLSGYGWTWAAGPPFPYTSIKTWNLHYRIPTLILPNRKLKYYF